MNVRHVKETRNLHVVKYFHNLNKFIRPAGKIMLSQLAYLQSLFQEMEVWCNRSPSITGLRHISVLKLTPLLIA